MKKWLIRWSIWLPILFLGYIHVEPVKLYIRQLDINFYYTLTVFLFTIFTVSWLCLPSWRRACRNGGMFELCFYLFPIELLLFIIFAQWHFVWACILGGVVVLATIGIAIYLLDVGEDISNSITSREKSIICKRFFVLAACVVLADTIHSVYRSVQTEGPSICGRAGAPGGTVKCI